MKRMLILIAIAASAVTFTAWITQADETRNEDTPKKKVLMYSASFGFRHSCVTRPLDGGLSHAEKAFKKFATDAGYEVFLTQDHNELKNDGQFDRFDAIVFYTTDSPPINRDAFLTWLRDAGAFIGVHCATDTFYDWKEYGRLIGGSFETHGPVNHMPVTLDVEEPDHPATCMLGDQWTIADEIYHIRDFRKDDVAELISVDQEATPEEVVEKHRFKKGRYYPVSWTNTEGKGRVFYTSLGHREDVWTNPTFQEHLIGGIAWALGRDKADDGKKKEGS